MNTALRLAVLALMSGACQPQTKPLVTPPAPAAPATPAPSRKPATPATAALPVTLRPEVLTMLCEVDLAPLWKRPDGAQAGLHVLEGFYGPEHYRLSLALTQVRRDSLQPNVFHVLGKIRYKKRVQEVAGDITIAQLTDYYFPERVSSQVPDSAGLPGPAQGYSALASFTLHSRQQPASRLQGVAGLDFALDERGAIFEIGALDGMTPDLETASEGAGLLLRGQWLNGPAGPAQPFVLSRNLMLSATGLFKDFGVGDRGGEINPKYAHLGWDDYWQNEEWWADAAQPALSL